jgi:hypothetical protein
VSEYLSDWRDRREEYLLGNGRADQLRFETRNDPDEPRGLPRPVDRFRLKAPRVKLVENDVERQCEDLLALGGWLVLRNHTGTFKSMDGRRWIKGNPKGTPDYTCIRGRAVFLLEVKRPGEKPSPDQEVRHNELRHFFRVEIVTVDCVEKLDAWLRKFN